MDEAQGEAEAAQAALEQKQAEYDTRWEESKEQLAAMQKLHYNGSLSILSQATNLFQLLNFSQALADITDKNTEVLTRLDTEAAELEQMCIRARPRTLLSTKISGLLMLRSTWLSAAKLIT